MAHTSTNFEAPENRVSNALKSYAAEETQLIIANPLTAANDADAVTLRLNHYSSLLNRFRHDATADEKLSLKFVEHQIKNLQAQLNPTPFKKLLYSKAGNAIRNFVTGNNLLFNKQARILDSIQKELIQNHNVKALKSSIAAKGFSMNMESQLEANLQLNLPEFHMNYLDMKNHNTLYHLHCKKIPNTNLYYFEKFEARANPSLEDLLSGNVPSVAKQSFDATRTNGINAGEAARLVHDKHIVKDNQCLYLEKTAAGRQPELVATDFNPDAELKKIKLPSLEPKEYHKLKAALQKGEAYQLPLELPGKGTIDCTVQYNPRNTHNKISVTDSAGTFINMNRFRKENLETVKQLANTVTNDAFAGIDWTPDPPQTSPDKKKRKSNSI
ncbi:hypothetical protein HNQ91_000698 [Filimonas zeae]|uniref:DUF3945 domain-containing protein n=1 Tax=Filimonas zeae TaxID=1737353 RepID=A0A917IQR2_9BACT|nr:hypothetical protein [Filimonas zeae]MDR6337676.1 hypothetical protein [Filimonas zeae]GGH59740.1 hypothetical protein GCM10011379_06850 [Filimonas zeae]